MKRIVKRSVGVLLILLIVLSTLTGCFNGSGRKYFSGDSYIAGEFSHNIYSKVESDKNVFNKNNVTLDFYYCLYSLDGNLTLESQKKYNSYTEDGYNIENNFAVYISDIEEIVFEQDDKNIIDYENRVNAKLWRFISFEEAFSTDYGYTTDGMKINYHHWETITIPSELFTQSSGSIFIHIVCIRHDVKNNTFRLGDYRTNIEIKYRLVGNDIKLS